MDNNYVCQRRLIAVTGLTVLVLASCEGKWVKTRDLELDAQVGSGAQDLAYFADFNGVDCHNTSVTATHWASGDTLEICFTGPGDSSFQADVFSALIQTWGAALTGGLGMVNNGVCPGTIPSTWISIHLESSATNNAGTGVPGKSNRLASNCSRSAGWDFRTDVQMQVTGDTAHRQAVATHEFGHVLGFYHESDRADNLGECSGEPDAAHGSTADWITVYDPFSIMNGCANASGRADGDYRITSLDILGAQMFYPNSLDDPGGCQRGCFRTATNQLIVRSDGIFTTDWKERGANDFPGTWTPFSGSVQTGEFASAALLGPGTVNVSFNGTNIDGTTRFGSVTIVKNNAYHGAILMTALVPL